MSPRTRVAACLLVMLVACLAPARSAAISAVEPEAVTVSLDDPRTEIHVHPRVGEAGGSAYGRSVAHGVAPVGAPADDQSASSSVAPPPPPPVSGGYVIGDEGSDEAGGAGAGAGGGAGGTVSEGNDYPWPVESPFISKDPNNPTVWGDKDKDGVDREDPFCKWEKGYKYCI